MKGRRRWPQAQGHGEFRGFVRRDSKRPSYRQSSSTEHDQGRGPQPACLCP